jgi:hypothetical protein
MENKNIQQSRSARDLAGSPPYSAAMVYKRHLGGVATVPYITTPGVWMQHKNAWCPVCTRRRSLVHSNLRTNLYNEKNTLIHVITQLYINKEHASFFNKRNKHVTNGM